VAALLAGAIWAGLVGWLLLRQADVALTALKGPDHAVTEADRITYLRPSRYADSDRLAPIAQATSYCRLTSNSPATAWHGLSRPVPGRRPEKVLTMSSRPDLTFKRSPSASTPNGFLSCRYFS